MDEIILNKEIRCYALGGGGGGVGLCLRQKGLDLVLGGANVANEHKRLEGEYATNDGMLEIQNDWRIIMRDNAH